jgi:tRNA(Arg) A34 adenosine deaminase TadA
MNSVELISRLLTVLEMDILPKARDSVTQGNGMFGAAILKKSDLSLIIAEVNNEVENPVWHGEVNVIKKLWEMKDRSSLPDAKDCIFLSTHEPCSLCLSAITWSGYDNFYYLFSYEDSRDRFNMPYDIQILKEVFGNGEGNRPFYNRKNAFWSSYNIQEMIKSLDGLDDDRQTLLDRMNNITKLYVELSDIYEANTSKPVVYKF